MDRKDFYLDWNRDILLGRELAKSRLVVYAMMEGIKLGHDFPAVEIFRLERNVYRIADGYKGGHHRAIAHRFLLTPLKSRVVEIEDGTSLGRIPINSIQLVEDYFEQQLYDSLCRLPGDVAERFCKENDLDPSEYLSQ